MATSYWKDGRKHQRQQWNSQSASCVLFVQAPEEKVRPGLLVSAIFPFEKKDEFESVRRICSLKSLKEMIKNVEALEERQRLAEAITWVAGCWEEDQVLGAAGKYLRVLQQVEDLKRENAALRERLSNRIHKLARPSPNGYVAHSPNGHQFCLPEQLNSNVLDDTQSEGSP